MKRFDKRFIYASLIRDFFFSLTAIFFFLSDFFFGEETDSADIAAVIPFLLIGFGALFLCFVIYRILYYRCSGYLLSDNEIICKRGVLFRKRSVLDYKRIHAINKKQNIIQRILGIAVLTVDSGSANTAHQAEITVIEDSRVVDMLLGKLNLLKEGGTDCETDEPKAEQVLLSESDSLYSFTSGKKMLYTLINIVTTALFTAIFAVSLIALIAICNTMLQLDFLGSLGEFFLYATLLMLGGMLLFSVFAFIGSIINSFIGYYGFKITKHDKSIQITYGLLEKHTNTFALDRIKAVKISQGIVQRMLGFASIRLEVIGYTVGGGEDNSGAGLGVLVPFCKYSEIGEILNKILPDYIPDEKETRSASFFPFVSWFLLIFGTVTGITLAGTLALMIALDAPPAVTAATALAIIGTSLIIVSLVLVNARLSYHTNGIAVRGKKLSVYSGGFFKNVTVFMAKHLVAVENVTTPLRKKRGIASLVMHLKTNEHSNEIKLHIQRDSLTGELEELLTL